MAVVEMRERAGYLFVAVLLGHILLISAQVQSKRGVPVLEVVTFGFFAEVQRGTSALVAGVREVWSGYVGLRGVRAENAELKQQLARAQVELQQQRALANRVRGFERLLDLRASLAFDSVAANVIAASATPEFRTLTLDKGTRHGLRTDMAVIAPAGVVGRIVTPSGLASKVQLLIDRNAAAGALIERTRAQGVVVGAGEELLRMEYVAEIAELVVGDTVVTSGLDGIYPKGFTIGRVEGVQKHGAAFRQILVRPAVPFSTLEEVLVVTTTPLAAPGGEESGR
jgi:rod shape-determining protein MreC